MRKKLEEDLELEYLRNPWYYNDIIFTEDLICKHTGFVYIIENLLDNRKYIGQKLFSKAKSRTVKGKTLKYRGVSTWKIYYGSNEDIKEDVKRLGRDNFKRTILYLCENKSIMNYLETWEIFKREALLREDYYNAWVGFKGSKKFLKLLRNNP